MKRFILGFMAISFLLISCQKTEDWKKDLKYFQEKGWTLSNYEFKLSDKGTFTMGDVRNVLLIGYSRDTTVYFEYVKRDKSLKAIRFDKLYMTKESDENLYHRIGYEKKDTLFYYTSKIPENATKVDSMTFIKGKEFYLKQIGKN